MRNAFLFGLVLSLAIPRVEGQVTLVRDGQDAAPILVPHTKHGKEAVAAKELARYLEAISGATFPIRFVSEPLPDRGIFVGPVDASLTNRLAPDAFLIRAETNRLYLTGSNVSGTFYAVFAFLEDVLGCRWWSWNEETLPARRATIVVPQLNRVVEPPFTIHAVWNREAQTSENFFSYKARTTGWERFSGDHTLYPLLMPYATNHPAIFPMNKDGERKPNQVHFCYSASGIAEALAEALAREVETRNGDLESTIYFAGMGDAPYGMCECPACAKIYEEETWIDPDGRKHPGYSATLLRMINRTAELLEQQYPGIRVGTFAYEKLEAPPAKTVPRSNVVIRVAPLRHCLVHPAETCPTNREFRRNLERWLEIAPGRVYVWDYGANFHNFLYPFPCLYVMAANLKFYHRLGVRGLEIQGNYVSTGGDLAVLKNYIWRKIMWDPKLDPKALLREFSEGYYGPAADAMVAYVEALEDSVQRPGTTACSREFDYRGYWTPDVQRQLAKRRDQAIAAARGREPYLRRVKEATIGLEAFALWRGGPLEEHHGKLIRTDLGGYTYPRAQRLLQYIRNASPREYGSGRSYHIAFLTWHGGPLFTLRRGAVEAKIAPVLAGQLRQIRYRGKELLHVETDTSLRGYPFLGGSITKGVTALMTVVGEPTGNSIKLEGEVGIDMWSPNTKQRVWMTIDLLQDGSLAITGTVQRLVGTVKTRDAVVTTVYAAEPDSSRHRVEYLSADQKWVAVEWPATGAECKLPSPSGLRIRFPSKGCMVVDLYSFPEIKEAQLQFDPERRILTTAVTTTPVEAPMDGEAPFLIRKIQVMPSKGTPF